MHGQRVGYIRVSTLDQNPERQLEQVALDRVYPDYAWGKGTERPQLEALLSFVREGDAVVVHSMDRLARNLDDLRRLVQGLTGRGVRVEFIKEHLTFTGEDSPMATLLLSVMGAFAEFERALIRERQREDIALAKQRGVYRGRRRCSPRSRCSGCGSAWSRASRRRNSPASWGSAARPSTNTCEPDNMPRRRILTSVERASLLAVPAAEADRIRHFSLSESDLSVIRQRRGAHNRLGFAVQLCTLRYPGIALAPGESPPEALLGIVARQLRVDLALWPKYAEREVTRREHGEERNA